MTSHRASQTAPERAELPAETAEKLRAFVRALARMAAQADYQEAKSRTDQVSKGSDP